MNDQDIRSLLHTASDPAVDDQPDLWPAIRARLTPPAPAPRATYRIARRGLRLAASLVLVLLLGVVTTAVMQGLIDLDPGLRGARAGGMVTELAITTTHEHLTVTLNWAYADANRLAINYTLRDARYTDTALPYGRLSRPSIRVGEDDYILPLNLEHVDDSVDGEVTKTSLYDTSELSDVGDTLSVIFALPLRSAQFELPLEIPFHPALLAAGELTHTVNGYTVTLNDFRVTNTMITFDMCYEHDDLDQYWVPRYQLYMDGVRVEWDEMHAYLGTGIRQMGGEQSCQEGGWFLAVDDLPQSIRLEIPYLSTPFDWSEAFILRFAAVLEAEGIRAELAYSDDRPTLNFPDGLPPDMDSATQEALFEQAVAAAREAGEISGGARINGPWVFSFPAE
jgi:hypothetical protein